MEIIIACEGISLRNIKPSSCDLPNHGPLPATLMTRTSPTRAQTVQASGESLLVSEGGNTYQAKSMRRLRAPHFAPTAVHANPFQRLRQAAVIGGPLEGTRSAGQPATTTKATA